MSEEVTYRQAIQLALADAMEADADVFMIGEDIGRSGGAFKLTEGLFDRFGESRVLDTPISEQAIIGLAVGAGARGLRPVAEIMFADFAAVCFDGIVNEMAKYRYMTGGQVTMPVTVRLGNGAGAGFGAQHSQACENWFLGVAGLKLALPATPADVYALLRAAIEDPDPVLVFEHKALFNLKGPLDRGAERGGLGEAEIVREGADVTVIATGAMRHRALEAAELLERDGIAAEVIDPRTLVPLDFEAVAASLRKTANVTIVQESAVAGSWGASLAAELTSSLFDWLDSPPKIVAADDTPVPYSEALERSWAPTAESIAAEIRTQLA